MRTIQPLKVQKTSMSSSWLPDGEVYGAETAEDTLDVSGSPRGVVASNCNTDGDFQELGKERKRAPKADTVPMKRVKRVVDRWVHGPNPKYQLEAGESELVTKAVWVSVPMW